MPIKRRQREPGVSLPFMRIYVSFVLLFFAPLFHYDLDGGVVSGGGDEVDAGLDVDVHAVVDLTDVAVEAAGDVIDAAVVLRFAAEEAQ